MPFDFAMIKVRTIGHFFKRKVFKDGNRSFMIKENTVLIVDDEKVNRLNLGKILGSTYEIVEAENGQEAIEILQTQAEHISAIVLDLIMPEFDGYAFMKEYAKSKTFGMIPVVIATVEGDAKTEKECLELGAWDFVSKPYDASIIQFRVKNVIDRSQHQLKKELNYRTQYSELAEIYNLPTFQYATEKMLEQYPDKNYVMIRMDIDKFRLVNAFFGAEEGDNLLKYIANYLLNLQDEYEHVTFGHVNADIFAVCLSYEEETDIFNFMKKLDKVVLEYPLDFDVVMTYGLYLLEDNTDGVGDIYERANLAAKKCKDEFNIRNYAFFQEKMRDEIVKEQMIVNNMRGALSNNEFVLYLQPKYELHTNTLSGGEVLVRWLDPKRGMISPGDFIPVFERNGFIMKLDFYVWEKACQLIRKWLDEGRKPYPISVNISRVSLYNPRLTEMLCGLVQKYNVPPALLQLELTESAYTTNQPTIKSMMSTLQQKGFQIMMDDFGSGYSSLNVLKDIEVDILKIDMRFLSDTENEARSENILAAVVRMAKWLNLPVIAEGVERKEQVLFLKSIGCEYVQGYYFARPMPVEEYEKLAFETEHEGKVVADEQQQEENAEWSNTSQLELLFSNMVQAVAVYEYGDADIEVVRVNNAYYNMFGFNDIDDVQKSLDVSMSMESRKKFFEAFEETVCTKEGAECEVLRRIGDKNIWVRIQLRYMNKVGKKHVVYGCISDVTAQKEIVAELQKYRQALSIDQTAQETMLVVDDAEINRASLISIFEDKYRILEASNGKEALEVLEREDYQVDIILLDLMMPEMDGAQFLLHKKEIAPLATVPVVIITADDTAKQQIDTMRMGANEYIVKPFIPEIVVRRVENVLDSSSSFRRIMQVGNIE